MSLNTGTESQFEETVIDRLKALGYRYQYGGEVGRAGPTWMTSFTTAWWRRGR
jgi:hypothetical protein